MRKKKITLLKCHQCQNEIPKSAAITAEGKDYLWNFCSKKCLTAWVQYSKPKQ